MRRILVCFLLWMFSGFESYIYSQQKEITIDQRIRPFIMHDIKINSADTGFLKTPASLLLENYAVKTPLPKGTILHRRLSDELQIVSFSSYASKLAAQKKGQLIARVNNLWKLSPELLSQNTVQNSRSPKPISLLLTVTDMGDFEKKYGANPQIQILYRYPETGSLLIRATETWMANTALEDANINFIASAKKPVTERELTGFDLSTNKVNMAHRSWPAINGRGLTVSIKENQMDTADLDFTGRYRFSPGASTLMQTHATTMATMAAGGGNTYYTGKGIAWGATISSSDFSNLLPDKLSDLQQLNVAVQNHSYGVGIENYYGADAAAYDAQLSQNPYLLHVFSAGNSGNQTSSTGTYAGIGGFANLTGSFKMAKNILTVGATDSFGNVVSISSRGPAYDGRVKPELVALGEDGSSGAAAIVSGMALLIRDAWQQMNTSSPAISAALLKAILLNSADDVGAAGIDYSTGYGSANAWRSLQTVAQNRVIQGTVSQGQSVIHTFSVPANATKLKLTICWTDPPATSNSFKALVNDVDMELSHAGTAQQWLPWVLNSKPYADSLLQLPVRKRDSLNNTEQITVDSPPSGNYQIKVNGYSINGIQQGYAIAWQYDTTEHFIFTYPVKVDNLFPLQTHTIRWETTLSGKATMQYRLHNTDWQTIASDIDLSKKYYQWQVPDKTATVQLRLLSGQKEWRSDTVSLSPRLLINTGFNCLDSFLVYWQKAAVDSYRVYRLGKQYMEPFQVLADTALIQVKKNNPYQYFTVAPMVPFQIEGVHANTFNYANQLVECYIKGFIADPLGTSSARLSLQLGTTYRVAKIVLQKLKANGFADIRTIAPVTNKQLISIEAADHGLNTYRARIDLQNGQTYYTNPEQVIIFGGQSYYIFPNPARPGATIRLLAEDFDDTLFRLYDVHGRIVAEQKIDRYLNEIKLPLLQTGIYYTIILKSGTILVSQPLVIQ